jgi:uncharacterized delta-60 repeat protein
MKLTIATLLALALVAAPAAADQGRALLPTGIKMPVPEPDAVGAQRAVALPDGGAVLVAWEGPNRGIAGVRMRADGTLDPSFHARVAVPGHALGPTGLLRRPDGRLLLSGVELSNTAIGLDELLVAQLTPDGALDPSFGTGGIARTGIAGYGGAALAPDGSVVVTGTDASRHWIVTRLTEAGAIDRSARVPGSRRDDYSTRVLVAADGRITVLGGRLRQALAVRLLPDLTADPAWAGGTPVRVPVHAVDIALGADGSVTALGETRVARLTPAGAPDAAYGKVDIGDGTFGHLLAEPDGGVLVYRTPAPQPRPAALPPLVIDRLSAAGARTTVMPKLRFGGGAAMLGSRRTSPLRQNGFDVGEIVRRPDGSYLAAGGVSLIQYTGEGEGFSSARHAVVALTPQLKLDRSFGPAFPKPSIGVRPLGRHGRTFRLRVKASMPGMLRIRVEDRRGRLLAAGLAPVHRAGVQRVRVAATKRRGKPAGYVATFRDLAGATAGVAALP